MDDGIFVLEEELMRFLASKIQLRLILKKRKLIFSILLHGSETQG